MSLNGTIGINLTNFTDGIDEDAIRFFGGLDTTLSNGMVLGC